MSEQRERIRIASRLSRKEQRSKGETRRAWSKSKTADLRTDERAVINTGAMHPCILTCILFLLAMKRKRTQGKKKKHAD